MESFHMNLNDFSDEILLMIFQSINVVEILYSLYNVNDHFTRILRDRIFTRRLIFVKNDFHGRICSDLILNRLCLEILPSIADQIHQFDLESSSIQQILHAAHYANLSHLSLRNLTRETIQWLLTDERLRCGIFKNQIRTLHMEIDENNDDETFSSILYVCENLFTIVHSLITLELDQPSYEMGPRLSFDDNRLDHFRSSTLLKLKINVEYFEDCLYLFDGRFTQLETVDVNVYYIRHSQSIPNENPLPNMKDFSICCSRVTYYFEEQVLPLLHRMSNLERLRMYFEVDLSRGFVDVRYLKRNILSSLPKLNQLTFCIHSYRIFPNEEDQSILERLQEILRINSNVGIISYGDYFPEENLAQYHFYSIPSFNEYFSEISNRFPGGIFPYIRRISLMDDKPFEDEFFSRIAQSFPQMEALSITNRQPQTHRQSDQRNLFPIKYNRLIRLFLVAVHDDYVEQFLLHTKTNLVQDVIIFVKDQSLRRVTHDFRRDQTQINCCKVNKLFLPSDYEHSDDLQEYFSHAKIEKAFGF